MRLNQGSFLPLFAVLGLAITIILFLILIGSILNQ